MAADQVDGLRVSVLRDIAAQGDSADENTKQLLRSELTEFIEDLERNIAVDRALLTLFDTAKELGVEDGGRADLEARLARDERNRLDLDLGFPR